MNTADALRLAKEQDLDLVEVSPNPPPGGHPIAKIMDYGKFMYRKERQEKKGAKKQKDQEMKTVRVGFKTGQHDIDFKARQVEGFLTEGHLVKVELTLRGREKGLAMMGKEKLEKFLSSLQVEYTAQDRINKSPYGWYIIIKKS